MGNDQQTILDAVVTERGAQDKQWGGAGHDDRHSNDEWVKYICHHANKAVTDDQFLERMIKVAALALAAAESRVRYDTRRFVRDLVKKAIKR